MAQWLRARMYHHTHIFCMLHNFFLLKIENLNSNNILATVESDFLHFPLLLLLVGIVYIVKFPDDFVTLHSLLCVTNEVCTQLA